MVPLKLPVALYVRQRPQPVTFLVRQCGGFWGSLKTEMVHHQNFSTRAEAKSAIREYIEVFYNRQRRHSRLGYQSPVVFAKAFS